jgi:hypothetical protein
MTAGDGRAALAELPEGEYSVQLYTPRLRSSLLPAPTEVVLHGETGAELELRFEGRLNPPHTVDSESLTWSHY